MSNIQNISTDLGLYHAQKNILEKKMAEKVAAKGN
jgi:hypothetical protein